MARHVAGKPRKADVRLTLTEEALGGCPASKEVHRDYIVAKLVKAIKEGKQRSVIIHGKPVKITESMVKDLSDEELEALDVDEVDGKGMTVLYRTTAGGRDDVPCMLDYQFKGFLKDAAKMLRKMAGSQCSKVPAYRQDIDGLVFVDRRAVPFMAPDGTPATVGRICERPLRAQTAQGERIALAASETVPKGCTLDFGIIMLDGNLWPMVEECLTYGQLRGLMQWRNSGKGTFTWKLRGEVREFGFGSPDDELDDGLDY